MKPPIALEYHAGVGNRPRWVTRLGVVSIVGGTLGLVGGVLQSRQQWQYVFDPTSQWGYPLAARLAPWHLAAVIGGTVVSFLLVLVGVRSLTNSGTVCRDHLVYAVCQLALVVLTAILGALLTPPVHGISTFELTIVQVSIECVISGAYPLFVLIYVLRKMRMQPI